MESLISSLLHAGADGAQLFINMRSSPLTSSRSVAWCYYSNYAKFRSHALHLMYVSSHMLGEKRRRKKTDSDLCGYSLITRKETHSKGPTTTTKNNCKLLRILTTSIYRYANIKHSTLNEGTM